MCWIFETFFSDEFTLSKLSTENYIRDARFEAHGAAIKFSADTPARWFDRDQLPYVFSRIDWDDTFLIAWHCQFDGLILSHHYGVVPKMYGCPMSMARMRLPPSQSVALDKVRQLMGMPAKRTPYYLFKGKRWHEMDQQTRSLVAEGACDEVESIFILFRKFMEM